MQGHRRSIPYQATLVAPMKLKLLSSLLILFSVCNKAAVRASCIGDDSKCSSGADDCCACDASIGQTTCGWEEPATCRDGYVAVPTPGADGGIHSNPSCEYSCYPPGCGSSLVYVAELQDYEGAQAACAARGGALAIVGSRAEALGTAWTGDPDEIWIADSAGGSYDTCYYHGGCPCISCADASETKPFICRLPPPEPSPPANPDAGHDHGATDAQMCPITRSFCTSSPSLPNNCNCGDCGYPACGDCDCDFYGDTSCCYSNGQPTATAAPSAASPDNNWRNYVRAPTRANSWNEASVYCTQNHDGLAIINSAEENLRAKDECGVNSAPALQAVDPQNSCVTSLASVCAQCAGSVSLRRISGTASGNGSWSTNRWVLPTPGPCWTGSMWVAL